MDMDQKKLRQLLQNSDKTFEQYQQHPSSDSFAEEYEQAKNELNQYMAQVRKSISHKSP
ncbi:hypothetical protein RS130_01700 [Paraglaciecola aquimarina]|uniref:Orphan protein n=1 Tax=Paraglaciecola aquimarina TaxID=1235557 RepID=A0ABU3SS56_9ALTE|nr:hypothetical protein [Paraglaciecola aquimarina]MDU0352807.1 hypothetical protein [Paraglaciecola aquimarina]